MGISYKDLSDKISAKLAFIRKRTTVTNMENAYKQLSQGIETLLPFIKEHSNELKEYTWDEWNKVTRLICRGQDILKNCNEGYSLEWQIKLLEEGIRLCGGNPADGEELSRLKLKQKSLDECRELCTTSCFQTLSLLKEELNISDNEELSYAFHVIAYWKEVQHEIALMGIDDVLDGTFKVESLTSNKQVEKFIINNKSQNDNAGDEHDVLLREIFGEHLEVFLQEAKILKKGSEVARLVKSYIRELGLKKDSRFNKPLWKALKTKGIININISAWNNAMI